MQKQDDDFPYTSDDTSLAPAGDPNAALSLSPQQISDLKASLRLLVGSALNGTDAYLLRLRRAQEAQESARPDTIVINENEAFGDRLKYLLLGIMFEAPDALQRGLAQAEKASSKAYRFLSGILSPVTNSRIFNPIRYRVDEIAARGGTVIDRLVMKGRIEEQNSRMLLQQKNLDDVVNEVLEYILLRTEVMEIVQESGVGVAGGMVDDFREQSATVDNLIEAKLKSLFKKRAPTQAEAVPGQAEGGE
jgi:hypothetical protein